MSDSLNTGGGSGPGASLSTSASLLQRVKTQDPEAWQRLVRLYGPLVYHWCRISGLKSEDTADIVQEVFCAVAPGIAGFRGDRPGSFRAWLRTVTRNKIYDLFRRRQGQAEAKGGTTAAEDALWRRAVELVRAEFEDRTWQAFWRVAVDGQPPAGVAEELSMTVHAVYQAKYRVLGRVRRELSDLDCEPPSP
jgi:RNA polymerase sigma-70 factor (ECF subfamily)